MPKAVRKVIHEPMWSEKALGVNVSGHPASTLFHISCDYRRKSTNTLFLDGTYVMSVSQIKKYPAKKIKGVPVHLIPFNDLEEKGMKQKEVKGYQPGGTQGEDLTIADNWKAATQLEAFKQTYLDPMYESVQKGWEYITTDKYQKECKAAGKNPNPEDVERYKRRYEEIKYRYDQFDKTYKRMFDLIMRHENLLSEIEDINAKRMELFPDGVPKELSPMQKSFIKHYFGKFDSYIRKSVQ